MLGLIDGFYSKTQYNVTIHTNTSASVARRISQGVNAELRLTGDTCEKRKHVMCIRDE